MMLFIKRRLKFKLAVSVISLLLFLPKNNVYASIPSSDAHELTLYIMPTMHPLDWSSPSNLYQSMLRCYLRTLLLSDHYLLGHLAIRLNTPLLDNPLLLAMRSGDRHQKIDLIVNQRIGFGILGTAWEGKIETEEELNRKFRAYERRNKLAFITYRIRKEAMQQILQFIEKFTSTINGVFSQSSFYGGTFWPLYHHEGSGCSNFGIAMLELAGLINEDVMSWEIRKRIPMHLIGGVLNEGKRVSFRTIRDTHSWAVGGKANVDWVEYQVFDPSLMFEWIHETRKSDRTDFLAVEKNDLPGLFFDGSEVPFDAERPIFIARPEPNLFIDHFMRSMDVADQ